MVVFKDYKNRSIRFTDERLTHIENDHPEMIGQNDKITETILNPDIVIVSKTDKNVEMFYKLFPKTPVTQKYLCVLVKNNNNDYFIITAYFTDTAKKGEILWQNK